MTEWRIEDLYDLNETIAVDIFEGLKFPLTSGEVPKFSMPRAFFILESINFGSLIAF